MIRQDQEHLQNQDHSHILQTEEAAGSASAREGWERWGASGIGVLLRDARLSCFTFGESSGQVSLPLVGQTPLKQHAPFMLQPFT